jgi:hypothetical protein
MKAQDIELTAKEVSLIYYFAVRKIAEISLNSPMGSAIQKKAASIFEGNGINNQKVVEFIKLFNKQKSKP